MKTEKLTTAQVLIKFLKNQYVKRDGIEHPFFAGCFGIFGHGNVAGVGQALQQNPDFRYYQTRNEQAMVHLAAAYAKMKNRLGAFACPTSVGPGATNMLTAAAGATINRLPVLLLPGDIFARRNVAPVLQQLESPVTQDISVNDCFKPVSKYWDRINRPEQLITSLPEVMRVLTSPAETGAVTLALPQDVQVETFNFPAEISNKRVWEIPRQRPDESLIQQAAKLIRSCKRPIIIAGGGVIYSEATDVLTRLVERTGIPVAETQAGKGALKYNNPASLGAAGVTGTPGANTIAQEADVVIGIGTRYSDFTTASKTSFQNPEVKFININVVEFDAHKHSGIPLTGDAKVTLEELDKALRDFEVEPAYRERVAKFNMDWDKTVQGIYHINHGVPTSQGEVIGAVNEFCDAKDVVLSAAGSLPGDLHKLWRTRDPKGYHMEYGYSCMGYEIAGGLGVKMADPAREVYVMVGDGSYLMMSQEIITAIQEGIKITVILINNNGYSSIGGLSQSLGSDAFGTKYRFRNQHTGQIDGEVLPVDLAGNARSLGAYVIEAKDIEAFRTALKEAKLQTKTTVIYIETDLEHRVEGYAWWEVPVAEVAEMKSVQDAYYEYRKNKENQRYHL